jgi:hypothetical protein
LQVLGTFEGKPSLPIINPRLSEIVKETKVNCDGDAESPTQSEKFPFAKPSAPIINPRLAEVLSPSISKRQPEKRQGITFACDNAEAQPASDAALPSGKVSNKRSRSSSPNLAKFCKKQKQCPTTEKVEDALLRGFAAGKMDEVDFILKCMLEVSKLGIRRRS